MAWLDDRVWCHPKLADLSDRAFRVWINGMAYSSGFGTRGVLTAGQQKTVGCDKRARGELIAAGLWNETVDGAIAINDWDIHNGKRDARRAADRERKRVARSAGRSAGQSAGRSTLSAHVEGSEGSEEDQNQGLYPHLATTADKPSPSLQQIRASINQALEDTA